jgi:hypothetical protein
MDARETGAFEERFLCFVPRRDCYRPVIHCGDGIVTL